MFDVKVTAVNTLLRKGKNKAFRGVRGRQQDMKKAIVTLADGGCAVDGSHPPVRSEKSWRLEPISRKRRPIGQLVIGENRSELHKGK